MTFSLCVNALSSGGEIIGSNLLLRDNDYYRICVINLFSAPMRANAETVNPDIFAEKLPELLVIARVGKRIGQMPFQLHLHFVMRETNVLQPGLIYHGQKLIQGQRAVV